MSQCNPNPNEYVTSRVDEPHQAIRLSSKDGDPHRLARLQRVIGYARGASGSYYRPGVLDGLAGLCDWSGTLLVTWRRKPKKCWMRLVESAWASDIGDFADIDHIEEAVQHEIESIT